MCTVLQKVTCKCEGWEKRDLNCSKYLCVFFEFAFSFVLFF